MKNTVIILSFVFCLFTPLTNAQITTFGGDLSEWGWSGNRNKEEVVQFLKKNWKEGEELSLQEKAQKEGFSCEFLWKVPPEKVDQALVSGSSFMTGQKIDSLEICLWSNGRGQITLYSEGKISGKVQSWTSSKREGAGRQLSAGDYKVTGLESKGWSKTLKTPMLYKVSLDGEAAIRGIFLHQGDLSGEKLGINEYHGCIRVSRLTAQRFMKLLSVDVTTVKVVWK